MVVCGQQYGLKALRQAQLHRFWSIGTKRYSTKQVSKNSEQKNLHVATISRNEYDACILQRRHTQSKYSRFAPINYFHWGNLIKTAAVTTWLCRCSTHTLCVLLCVFHIEVSVLFSVPNHPQVRKKVTAIDIAHAKTGFDVNRRYFVYIWISNQFSIFISSRALFRFCFCYSHYLFASSSIMLLFRAFFAASWLVLISHLIKLFFHDSLIKALFMIFFKN